MADTAKRLAGPSNMATSATTLYTVPGSTATILRSIHVTNTTALTTGAITFNLSIGADATGTRIFSGQSMSPGDTLDWSGFMVMNAAEILQGFASATGLTITVSGVEVA